MEILHSILQRGRSTKMRKAIITEIRMSNKNRKNWISELYVLTAMKETKNIITGTSENRVTKMKQWNSKINWKNTMTVLYMKWLWKTYLQNWNNQNTNIYEYYHVKKENGPKIQMSKNCYVQHKICVFGRIFWMICHLRQLPNANLTFPIAIFEHLDWSITNDSRAPHEVQLTSWSSNS